MWNDVTESSNTWNQIDYANYVLEGYWADDYVAQETQNWSETSESSNTWVVIG